MWPLLRPHPKVHDMPGRHKFSFSWGVAPALLLCVCPAAFSGGTPAGTVLRSTAVVGYVDGSAPATVTTTSLVTVSRSAGCRVALERAVDDFTTQRALKVTVTNIGNDAAILNVGVSASYGWAAKLVADSNGDGVWQPAEASAVSSVGPLDPDESRSLFVLVSPNTSVLKRHQQGTIWVTVADSVETSAASKSALTANYQKPLIPRFVFRAESALAASPTVVNGLAVCGSEGGVLYAVYVNGANAGALAWRYPESGSLGAPIRARVSSDGTTFCVAAGNIVARLAADGREMWRTTVGPTGKGIEAMPLFSPDGIVVACGDGKVRRLDPADGAVLSVSPPLGTGALSTPSMPGTGELWVGGADGSVYDLKTGTSRDEYSVLSSHTISGQAVSATPFVDIRAQRVVTVSAEGSVYAMQLRTGQTLWGPVALGSPVRSAPWVDSRGSVVYLAGTDNTLHALRASDGAPVDGYPMLFEGEGGFASTPVVVPRGDGRRVLFAANDAGRLYAVDAANPAVWAMFDTGNSQSRFLGSPAVSGTSDDDVVVAACTDGGLYAFRLAEATDL